MEQCFDKSTYLPDLGKLGHTANICFFRYNKEFNNPKQTHNHIESTHLPPIHSSNPNPSALIARSTLVNPESVVDPSWYGDSAATHHVTNNPKFLTFATDFTGVEKVVVSDGNQLKINK